jgi:ABC-type transport system substrate-binding protein
MRFVVPVSALALLAGCASPRIPAVEPAAGIVLPSGYFAGARPEAGLEDAWWYGFDDPELDALIERALARNPSLEAARQRLAAARAIIVAEQSDFLPIIDGELAACGGSTSTGGFRPSVPPLSLPPMEPRSWWPTSAACSRRLWRASISNCSAPPHGCGCSRNRAISSARPSGS